MAEEEVIRRYGKRVGYTESEIEKFHDGGHRTRQVSRLSRAAGKYSIKAEVVESKNCNSGHTVGQTLILDVDGNFITKLCPNRLCVYLISQLIIPVALINERLSESLEPNDFHFMRYLCCPDTGVDCFGYGEECSRFRLFPGLRVIKRRRDE